VEEQNHFQAESKRKLLEEKAHSEKGCQVKSDFPFTNEVKRVHGISEGGVALSAANQVKDACKVIQQSLFNLLEGVQVCNSISIGPKQGVSQGENRGEPSKRASVEGPIMVSNGKTATQPCTTDKSVAKSSSPPFNLCVTEAGHGEHLGARSPLDSVSGVHPCHAVHECSKEEGSFSGSSDPQSSGKSRWSKEENVEGSFGGSKESVRVVMASKTSLVLRRLRDNGQPIAQPKWRSNGGVGSSHQGANSSSRLSQCSFVESSTDINLCNNQIKNEVKAAESVRIWDFGQNLGMQCSGNVGNVVGELDCMEARENEIKKGSRVGGPTKLL